MSERQWSLAQLNIALPREPLSSALLSGFVDQLVPLNELADRSPGFVWRLQTEDGDATAIRAFDDDRLIVNLTLWESLEALAGYVFGGLHLEVMRNRRVWFERIAEAFTVLWWVPAGSVPTVAEAEDRLALLREHGPTPAAFSFRTHFPPPVVSAATGAGLGLGATDDDRWGCPAG